MVIVKMRAKRGVAPARTIHTRRSINLTPFVFIGRFFLLRTDFLCGFFTTSALYIFLSAAKAAIGPAIARSDC
jgi:hypothetical protein